MVSGPLTGAGSVGVGDDVRAGVRSRSARVPWVGSGPRRVLTMTTSAAEPRRSAARMERRDAGGSPASMSTARSPRSAPPRLLPRRAWFVTTRTSVAKATSTRASRAGCGNGGRSPTVIGIMMRRTSTTRLPRTVSDDAGRHHLSTGGSGRTGPESGAEPGPPGGIAADNGCTFAPP